MKSIVIVGPRVVAFICLWSASVVSINAAWPAIRVTAHHESGNIHSRLSEQGSIPSLSQLKSFDLPRPLDEYKGISFDEIDSMAETAAARKGFFMRDGMNAWQPVPAVKATKRELHWIDPTILDDAEIGTSQKPDIKQNKPQLLWVDKISGTPLIKYLSPTQKTTTKNGWDIYLPKTILESDTKQFETILKPGTIVHEGEELPKSFDEILKKHNQTTVLRKSYDSPNRTWKFLRQAANLGRRPLKPGAQIMSALPQHASVEELVRMGLPFSQQVAWLRLKIGVEALNLPHYKTNMAPTREQILDVLSKDTNDALVLVAHNNNGKIQLSGSNGAISFEEISNLKRDEAPDRTIILVTCNAGTVNGSSESLGELMVKNKLAKAVFASPHVVDAKSAPGLLTELHNNSSPGQQNTAGILEVLKKYGDYRQIVPVCNTLFTNFTVLG